MKLTGVALLIAVVTSVLFVAACGGGKDRDAQAVAVKEIAPTDAPEPTSAPDAVSTRSSAPPPISMVLEAVSPELLACVQTALGDDQYNAIISGRQDAVAQQLGMVLPCIMQYPQEANAIMEMFGLDIGTIMAASTPIPNTITQPKLDTPVPTATPSPPAPTPTITPGVPESSASAITSPPASAEGINTQTDVYGTSADPNIITLGPKIGGPLGGAPYPNKTSMEFELTLSTPVLAPIDMVLVGFDNRNAKYRTYPNGQQDAPFNDLELCFESESPDWPGMIVCTYHLSTSPLLLGHNQNVSCGEVEEWQGTIQAVGHLFFEFDDYVSPGIGEFGSCDALIGRSVKRGAPIGFAGSVGTHSMAPFRFKVSHTSENPTVQKGNRYLHWVQPGSFFYWKCYSPGTNFPSGVLAYPFECGSYQLPAEQRDVSFKYSSEE